MHVQPRDRIIRSFVDCLLCNCMRIFRSNIINLTSLLLRIVLLCCFMCVNAYHPDEVDEFTCSLCNSSFYCISGNAYQCPFHSASIDFASAIEECVCLPGYNRTGDLCFRGVIPFYYDKY